MKQMFEYSLKEGERTSYLEKVYSRQDTVNAKTLKQSHAQNVSTTERRPMPTEWRGRR